MSELFDGRLETHGVRELITSYTSEERRFLTDREGNELLVRGDDRGVKFCLGKGEQTGRAILDVIRTVFDTRIFDGNEWISVYRPTGPIRLAEMIDGRLERVEEPGIGVVNVLRGPNGTPRSAMLCGSQASLWVHANDDGMVEYADAYVCYEQNCGPFFLKDIEKVFGCTFNREREEVGAWSTSSLNRYGTDWS
jgi:hypothetical protein